MERVALDMHSKKRTFEDCGFSGQSLQEGAEGMKSLKDLELDEKYKGCICPLSQKRCLGPLCAWWNSNRKACSVLSLSSLLGNLCQLQEGDDYGSDKRDLQTVH